MSILSSSCPVSSSITSIFGVVLCVVCFIEVYSASVVVLDVVIGLVEAAVGSSTFSSVKSNIIVLYAEDLLPILLC